MRIVDRFDTGLHPDWQVMESGGARVTAAPGGLHLTAGITSAAAYTDAQISDYPDMRFRWRPPLRMTVTAHAAPDASMWRGTAGFGFWNQPFMPGRARLRLPQAIWFFFAGPPSQMQLALGVPGAGWKAATFDAHRWQFLALLPLAALGVLLMRIPALYRRLWPVGQRAIGVSEHLLETTLLNEPHTYTIDWRRNGATFAIDGAVVHEAPAAPSGPLGFIAWVDNQFAVVTPQGHLRLGLVPLAQEQTLQLGEVRIETGTGTD